MLDKDQSNENYGQTEKYQSSADSAAIFFLLGILYVVCCIVYVFFG